MGEDHVHVHQGGGCAGCLLAILMIVVLAMLFGWMDPPAWLMQFAK